MITIIDLIMYYQNTHLKTIQKDYRNSSLLILFFPLNKKGSYIWRDLYHKQRVIVMWGNKILSWNIKGHIPIWIHSTGLIIN